jgi:omega-hydroxy-beta-dihydromenaquinone-9 sulfotransferase
MPKRPLIAIPYPHFMAFAPLDAWARLLLTRPRIPFAYLPRLAFALFTSTLGTLLTLPERLVLALLLRMKYARSGGVIAPARAADAKQSPPHLVVLGYYRTGTTHLHYMLACDPRFRTPKWCETLVPQGFVLSWAFMRMFLVPFMGGTRPMDEVSLGPEWPAEDDFAAGTWAMASALPGRMILPSPEGWARYSRFHGLEGLTPRELDLWRRVQWGFLSKLSWLSRGGPLLIKTPSHTARVDELLRLFGKGNVKFVHISRPPEPVIRSNVAMLQRFRIYNLQDEPDQKALRARIEDEYAATERKYLLERGNIPAGDVCEVRFEDLHADPLGQARRIYRELGLDWTPEYEANLLTYLDTVRAYRPANRGAGEAGTPRQLPPAFAEFAKIFGHDRPGVPKVEAPPPPTESAAFARGHQQRRIVFAAIIAPLAALVLWTGIAFLRDQHFNGMIWPTGVIVGWSILHAARAGTARLGALAVALTAIVMVLATFINTRTVSYIPNPHPGVPVTFYPEVWHTSIKNLTEENTLIWKFVGLMSAYRFASRRHISPFGSR